MGRLSCGTIDAGKAPQQGANSPRRESGGRPRAQKPATGVNANPVAFVERSCIIDGEAVACDDNGIASFDLVRHHRANDSVFLYAFDLIELNGDDLRRDPLEIRKATLASIVAKASPGIRFNEHIEGDAPTVFALQGWPRRHRLEAKGFRRPLGRLAQNEESSLLGGEAGSGGGLGALIALAGTFSAASHKTSTLRSPAFASSMIFWAIISSVRSAGRSRPRRGGPRAHTRVGLRL